MKPVFYLFFFISLVTGCQPKIQPRPNANFDFSFGSNGQVIFTNKSSDADRYQWIFSDGQASTEDSPVVTFKKNGTYSVQLSARSKMGTDDITRSVDINNVSVQPKPAANFDFTIGSEGQVRFTNKSTNAERYQWIFSDGQATAEANPVVTFKTNGIYSVQLTAKTSTESDVITRSLEITDIVTTGTVMFWTNATGGSDIEVYVENQLRGLVTQAQSSAPDCGSDGYATLTFPVGTYSYYAKSKTRNWSGTFTIKKGACSTKLLAQ